MTITIRKPSKALLPLCVVESDGVDQYGDERYEVSYPRTRTKSTRERMSREAVLAMLHRHAEGGNILSGHIEGLW